MNRSWVIFRCSSTAFLICRRAPTKHKAPSHMRWDTKQLLSRQHQQQEQEQEQWHHLLALGTTPSMISGDAQEK